MREKKTRKQKRIQITASLKRELKWFIEEREIMSIYYKVDKVENRPIGRNMAYKILSGAAAEFGLDEIGTHTLGKDVRLSYVHANKEHSITHGDIQSFVREGHVTLYRVNQDAMDKAMTRFKI